MFDRMFGFNRSPIVIPKTINMQYLKIISKETLKEEFYDKGNLTNILLLLLLLILLL